MMSISASYLLLNHQPARGYRTAPVERGDIATEVMAAGSISALVRTEISSQLSGQVTEVLVDFNDPVKQGQILARLDPRTYEARVREAQARLDMAKVAVLKRQGMVEQMAADLANAEALREVAEAEARSSRAKATEAKLELERRRGLTSKALISEREVAEAQAEYDSKHALLLADNARIQVHAAAILAAKASARIAETELAYARTEVRQREAALEQNQVDLRRAEIRSPMDGIVIRRDVDIGQTVAASLQAPTLFTIARDLSEMTLECRVDEADIGRIELEQEVSFSVDAYPGRRFSGRVIQIRKAPETLQNVVTYSVIVSAANHDQALFPGMTAIARILVDEARDILKLPNAALRYLPSGMESQAVVDDYSSDPKLGLPASVWVLGGGDKPRAVKVRTGATDERFTVLLSGPLQEGDELIVGESDDTP
jgi:HlyD family secretion protein